MRSKSPSESKSTALRNPHEVRFFTISNSIGKRSNPSLIISKTVPDEQIIKSRKPSLFQSAASKLSKALSVLLFNKLMCIENVVLWLARICLNHKISISCLGSNAQSHFFNQAMIFWYFFYCLQMLLTPVPPFASQAVFWRVRCVFHAKGSQFED